MGLFDVIQNNIGEAFWKIQNLVSRINTHVANATDKDIYAKVDVQRMNVKVKKDKQEFGFEIPGALIKKGKVFLFDN